MRWFNSGHKTVQFVTLKKRVTPAGTKGRKHASLDGHWAEDRHNSSCGTGREPSRPVSALDWTQLNTSLNFEPTAGPMTQSLGTPQGLCAAAGSYSLDHHSADHRRDNRRAQWRRHSGDAAAMRRCDGDAAVMRWCDGGGDWPYATMEHSRVSRAAPRAGPATVARKCGPAGPSRGRGPAWADNEPYWAVPPENVLEDEPDVLY